VARNWGSRETTRLFVRETIRLFVFERLGRHFTVRARQHKLWDPGESVRFSALTGSVVPQGFHRVSARGAVSRPCTGLRLGDRQPFRERPTADPREAVYFRNARRCMVHE
jgi:hypothetical protein